MAADWMTAIVSRKERSANAVKGGAGSQGKGEVCSKEEMKAPSRSLRPKMVHARTRPHTLGVGLSRICEHARERSHVYTGLGVRRAGHVRHEGRTLLAHRIVEERRGDADHAVLRRWGNRESVVGLPLFRRRAAPDLLCAGEAG